MSTSYTRSTTTTTTYNRIVHVTRKVQADFLAILDTYGYFSEKYAQDLIHDIREFLDEGLIERVKFIWIKPNSNYVLDELDYLVIDNGIGLADDRSGGIRYQQKLSSANFRVYITYNKRWKDMTETDKKTFREGLSLQWGTAGQLNYSGGHWVPERTYSKDGYGLTRSRFIR